MAANGAVKMRGASSELRGLNPAVCQCGQAEA